MTLCPFSTTSVTISPRRHCGSSHSRSSHGTSRAAKQSGRKRRKASLPSRTQMDSPEEAIKEWPWRQLWATWELYDIFCFQSLQEFWDCTASWPVNICEGECRTQEDVAVEESVSLILWMHGSTHLQPVMQFLRRRVTFFIITKMHIHDWLRQTLEGFLCPYFNSLQHLALGIAIYRQYINDISTDLALYIHVQMYKHIRPCCPIDMMWLFEQIYQKLAGLLTLFSCPISGPISPWSCWIMRICVWWLPCTLSGNKRLHTTSSLPVVFILKTMRLLFREIYNVLWII